MSSNLVDTEAGGETSQYESIQTVTNPHSKQDGQLGAEETQTDAAPSQEPQDNPEHGEKTAANLRCGRARSGQGMGGKKTEAIASQDGFGCTDSQPEDYQAIETRHEQGYGSDSGVGG